MSRLKTLSKQKWNYEIINRKTSLSFNNKENLLVSCYDIIMELRELSEISEDYIAEMLMKLGLETGKLREFSLHKMKIAFMGI